MGKKDERIDAYIANSAAFAQPILTHLRDLIHEVCPDVEETWKWSFPNFDYKGASFVSMAGFKSHCSFGFWRASIMDDPDNILQISEKAGMGNLGKITNIAELPTDTILRKYLKAALKLNEDGIKVPKATKTKSAEPIVTPDDLAAAITANEAASVVYSKFSNSHKKEYVEWIEEAKTLTTRNKRIAQAVEMIAENKSKNWKYK
jgi:uncharacterized protein YdeI (YjbR/CyaY-like superfamily)